MNKTFTNECHSTKLRTLVTLSNLYMHLSIVLWNKCKQLWRFCHVCSRVPIYNVGIYLHLFHYVIDSYPLTRGRNYFLSQRCIRKHSCTQNTVMLAALYAARWSKMFNTDHLIEGNGINMMTRNIYLYETKGWWCIYYNAWNKAKNMDSKCLKRV